MTVKLKMKAAKTANRYVEQIEIRDNQDDYPLCFVHIDMFYNQDRGIHDKLKSGETVIVSLKAE